MNKKFKIMNQRPQASDEEIKNFMDFKGVLTQHDQQIRIIKRSSLIKKITISSVALITAGVIYWVAQKPQQPLTTQLQPEVEKKEVVAEPDQKKELTESVVESVEEQAPASPPKDSKANAVKNDNTKQEPTSTQPVVGEEKPAEDSYVQAEPAKGYPQEALKDSIQGVSTVSFIINKDGSHTKVEVVNSLGPAFDKEIARLVENMPEWKPALLNGKPVPSKISLPITFQFQKVKSK
jgi:TonB family protein